MIRATIISTADQALLSALNLGLAVLLIHFATKPEYGLYSQLMNLQSFFSPLHAGIFSSAFLALASKMDRERQAGYRTAMARAEVITSTMSTVIVVATCLLAARFLWPSLTTNICVAFGVALLGLWWREFVRQMKFSIFRYDQALRVDVIYVLVTATAGACVVGAAKVSSGTIFWCMAIGGVAAAGVPLASATREVGVDRAAIKRDVLRSWSMGRWDVLGSIVTWGYAQSYVYFAALHGGLDAAAEISGGRLLAMPLALMWASYANVLRPTASRLLTSGSDVEIRRLSLRSALFVVASSLLYAIALFAAIPILDQTLFAGKFMRLRPLTMWWIVYFMLTGISTVASSVLRSALEFREVFHRQLLSCVAAIILLTVGLRLQPVESLVIALVIVEVISACLFWRRLNVAVSLRPKSA
jgi:O-antigen/teichoic acid export membrane protein